MTSESYSRKVIQQLKSHVNIPIFIPHYGCNNACVFCNQTRITGKPCFSEENVKREINEALSTVDFSKTKAELAFFGGSFTAIPRNEMLTLLKISDDYLSHGKIDSVRLSTRPDAIDEEILNILKAHGVKTVELGIQSTSENVLSICRRGHTREHTENACKLIKKYGFTLVGQMMIGLPGSTPESELATARDIISFGADAARIYPTVVLPGTELSRMEKSGLYTALSIQEAAMRCANVLDIFARARVKVIRIGLCANEILHNEASPDSYHAAIGEFTRSTLFLRYMENSLKASHFPENSLVTFTVAKGKISQAVGQKRVNIQYLENKFGLRKVQIKDSPLLSEFDIELSIQK